MAMIRANGIDIFHKQHGDSGDWLPMPDLNATWPEGRMT